MKPFWQAIHHSLRYRWSIIGAIVSSFFIAILWSASISTMYPFVEVILSQKNAHQWLSDEVQKIDDRITKIEGSIASELALAEPNSRQLDLWQDRLRAEILARQWFIRLQPWIEQYAPHSPFTTLVWALGWLLVTTFLKGILLVLSSLLVAHVSNRTVMDLRRIYYRKALQLDQRKIDNIGTSNLMTHLSHNMLMVSGGLQAFYGKMIREPLKMLVCLVGAAWISWPLLLISLIVVPFGAWVVQNLSSRMKRSTQREMEGMGAVFQTLIETFSAIKTVRVFQREMTERQRFKRNAASLYRMSLRISLYDSLLRPFTELLGIVSISLSILAGAYLVLFEETTLLGIPISNRPLSPSSLLLFYTFLAGASDPARKMSEVVNILVRAGTACENMNRAFTPLPAAPLGTESITSSGGAGEVSLDRGKLPTFQKTLRFEGVTFCYRPRQPVVRRVSFSITRGETVAIVGGNGSGKSTLANLLLRFYDPHLGGIYLDDQNIQNFHPRHLRRLMAWVTQDSQLFNGSIRENIAYGKYQASEAEIRRAAEMALVTDFTESMNEGWDTLVGDDGRLLSAGQRQRVALARAILADPELLILDEATSQIDGKTELRLHESMRSFLKSRTTIIVTHRASSLALVDRVLVMEQGLIVADSPVHEIRERSPEFQYLFAKSA